MRISFHIGEFEYVLDRTNVQSIESNKNRLQIELNNYIIANQLKGFDLFRDPYKDTTSVTILFDEDFDSKEIASFIVF